MTVNFEEIPIIDLKDLKDPADRKRIADEVRNACIQVGFFYVINHGIPEHITEGALEMTKNFFSLPIEAKMEVERPETPPYKGYSPLLTGNNCPEGDLYEAFELGWESSSEDASSGVHPGANVWPSDVPRFRQTVLDYFDSAANLGEALFSIFASALSLPEHFFNDRCQHSAIMKLLHYPPQTGPFDERSIGMGAHTDWQCFTILLQQPGIQALQVLNSDKQWVNAPPIPGGLLINIGDQFARWSNDVFKTAVHRAVNRSGVCRYSIPLFFGTENDVKLEPIPSCISPGHPPRYEVITAGEYLKTRIAIFG